MSNFLQVFCVLFSAILVSASIPNEFFLLGCPSIALISLVPLYIVVAECSSYKSAFRLGALHTFSVHLFSSFWLAFFKDFAIFTLGASALGTGLIGGILGRMLYVPYARYGGCKNLPYAQESAWSRKRLAEGAGLLSYDIPFRVFWFSCTYTLYEWYKASGTGFLAYPWGTLSSSAFPCRLFMQIADITGTYGISFLFALCSAVCAEGLLLIKHTPHLLNPLASLSALKRTAHVCIALFALSFVYGAFQYAKPRTPEKTLNAVLVQQNSNPWNESSDQASIIASEKLSEEKIDALKAKGKNVHLVVWSEGVLRHSFPSGQAYYSLYPPEEPLLEFIKRMNVPFIIGGPYVADGEIRRLSNASLLFDAEGSFRGAYEKIHLVPFAEVLPGEEYEWAVNLMDKLVGISAGWKAGDQYVLFDIPCEWSEGRAKRASKIVSLAKGAEDEEAKDETPLVRVSAPVCFGDAFPSDVCGPLHRYGSDVFINITDDSWSNTKSAEYQHFVIASYRAIEYRTTLVRSTNAGYSVVLDPAGKLVADMPLFKRDALAVSIPVYKHSTTVYALFGNWLPFVFGVLIIAYCLYVSLAFVFGDDFIYETH
ncbi:apolipoprotein N-acyltransferase [Treponema sp. Marseille-Q4130]|uniref:apolipoprotein N-acyltransferase n=1 Tax=Treponema sp. Marseille-Q4130 TaxID=2766702 RepID=UPI00165242F0|nr:apolipoprotein N-acyltransferase [Treponema sp. Marseille-Q4130]MBC6719408.1 apolipoprotein N-acyltransferase [Treponema sp. Marseille-Q4130]